jgi:hypothetical protein
MTAESIKLIGAEPAKSWSAQILDWYSEGDFDVEVAAKLEIPVKEFYKNMETNAAFGRLVEYGRTLCEAYWVGMAKKLVKNKGWNAQPWVFVMKNKFNWADKSEQMQGGDQVQFNMDELRQQLQSKVKNYIAQYQPELTSVEKSLKVKVDD